MNLYKINILPQSYFCTPIKGDMFFGCFCCAMADLFGAEKLSSCLSGYTENSPFVVFSDAFPSGFLPKPCLPASYFYKKKNNETDNFDASKRKEAKKKIWLPVGKITLSTQEMQEYLKDVSFKRNLFKVSNKINPKTNHASGGEYSAYTIEQFRYTTSLEIYVLIDESKIKVSEVEAVINQIGLYGYGKRASAGGGKFTILNSLTKVDDLVKHSGTKFMALAPCVLRDDTLYTSECFYKVFVRFGRHGGSLATASNPFKRPVIMMDTNAVLTFKGDKTSSLFVGSGLKGTSLVDDRTVFQAYAPIIPILAEEFSNEI